ncbi:MAG: hypothetical protein COA79_10585 [Planctomycetota bacterium]|nr:MAG: hypothetical protein COA79_10585 [Planctomycetota bacterium]
MKESVQAFLDLQTIDQKILSINKTINDKSGDIQNKKTAYKKLDEQINNTQEVLKKSKIEFDIRSSDLLALNDKKDNLSAKLQNVKSNKEYKALEIESRNYKEEAESQTKYLNAAEENIKKMEESMEVGVVDLADLKKSIKDMILTHKKEHEDSAGAIEDFKLEREKQVSAINTLEDGLPADQCFLEKYNKLKRLPNGDAMALMEEDTCQGCYMRVNTQLASKIKSLKRMATCTSCHRILYVED